VDQAVKRQKESSFFEKKEAKKLLVFCGATLRRRLERIVEPPKDKSLFASFSVTAQVGAENSY
jgi:hypothetical protein